MLDTLPSAWAINALVPVSFQYRFTDTARSLDGNLTGSPKLLDAFLLFLSLSASDVLCSWLAIKSQSLRVCGKRDEYMVVKLVLCSTMKKACMGKDTAHAIEFGAYRKFTA